MKLYKYDSSRRYKDITGQKFGRLTALYRLHNYHKTGTWWLCICDCGNLKEVNLRNLQNSNTKSCGCLIKAGNHRTHDKTGTRLYQIWNGMKQRCYDKHADNYNRYGGRGIVVCDEWKDNFMSFYDWSIVNSYNDTLTIDRIDNNKGYSPNNCRWITLRQQANNRRSNTNIKYDKYNYNITQWGKILNLSHSVLSHRHHNNYDVVEMLTKRTDDKYLYPYQVKILADLYEYNKCGMFLEMGLGKSVLGTIKASSYNKPVLIIAPKSVIPQWEDYFKDWASSYKVYNLTNKKQLQEFIHDNQDLKMGVINYQSAWRRPELLNMRGYTLILDEAHNISNNTSKQSKFTMKLKFDNIILLTGTPCNGSYDKLYTQLKLLGLNMNKRSYEDRYCNFFDMEKGGVKFRVLSKSSPYKNIDELKNTIHDLGGRFLKTNDVHELPEQRFIDVPIAVSKEYQKFLKEDYIDLGDREYIAGSPTDKLLYSRYLCGVDNKNKLDVLTTLLEGIEDRVIVFYNFKIEHDVLTKICKKLKRKTFTCNGNVKQVDEFKKHDKSVLLVQYQAGATGLNLQFCNKVIYFSPTLSSNLYEQSKARTWRIGQNNKCTYWLLTCGVERDIMYSLDKKQDYTLKLFGKG